MLRIESVAYDSPRWEACRAIRQRVFVEEQACPPEEEWDEHDATSRHVLGYVENVPVATARWRVVEHEGQPVAKLERFAVLPEYRGHGYGRELVARLVADARAGGYPTQMMHAQAHLERFYRTFGFHPEGDVFDEVGIPHLTMVRGPGRGDE